MIKIQLKMFLNYKDIILNFKIITTHFEWKKKKERKKETMRIHIVV